MRWWRLTAASTETSGVHSGKCCRRGVVSHQSRWIVLFVGVTLSLLSPAADASPEAFSRGLLWRVWRSGVSDSYIFGTLHFADARLQALPPPVEAAFRTTRRFVMELYPDDFVAARFVEAGELPASRSLAAMLDAATYARMSELLVDRGLPPERIARMKPWAALLALTGTRAPSGQLTLDNTLYINARVARMRVEELDSVEEQIAVFDDVPEATQLALLAAYVRHNALLAELAETTIAGYLRRDLAAIHDARLVLERSQADLAPHHAIIEKKVIRDRSVVMAYRMLPYLRAGSSFIAIGALHLYGRHGVLRLLEKDGWRVTRIY